jgi:anthranilate phosphoribosyltransferase
MYKQGSMKNVINKLSTILVYSDKIPENYEKLVEKVKLLFLFATVFNPETKSLEYLNPDLLAKYKPEEMTM